MRSIGVGLMGFGGGTTVNWAVSLRGGRYVGSK